MSFPEDISEKANWVLNLILVAMSLILFRAWHLAIVQHDVKMEEARRPQNKTVMERANRGTIRDRFNIPLAINKIQYNVSVIYQPIRHIPAIRWERDENGERIKRFKRKEYIRSFSVMLGKELQVESDRIEDLIHAKASLYNQLPFVIKEDITEEQYYRLKMLERDWLGLHVQKVPKRLYPYGRLASDIIGYMGAINRQEYETIFQEIKQLREFIESYERGESITFPVGFLTLSEVICRLKDLEERSYSINDYVGKSGVEGVFEHKLRGYHGKKTFYTDARGNFLRELQGTRKPISGQRILLTISAELQQHAEQLLMENEAIRKARISGINAIKQELMALEEPWIKGGSIIAMDPKTGEVLALASYPRTDPNDFVVSGNEQIKKQKQHQILRWFESKSYIAEIWDQLRPLERERYSTSSNAFYDESIWLTWDKYLDFVLPKNNELGEEYEVRGALLRVGNLKNAIELQKILDELLLQSGNNDLEALLDLLYPLEEVKNSDVYEAMRQNLGNKIEEKARLDPFLEKIQERKNQILFIDLLRMVVCCDRFDDQLIAEIGDQTLASYRDTACFWVKIEQEIKKMAKALFHEIDFAKWKEEESKEFLRKKRLEEKEKGRFARPYIDYFDSREKELFNLFWEKKKWQFALAFLLGLGDADVYLEHFLAWQKELMQGAHQALQWRFEYDALVKVLIKLKKGNVVNYLKTLRSFKELDRPLFGKYRSIRNTGGESFEKDLALAFYPRYGFGYGRSYAYRQAAHQGSLFKLVTAYQVLIEKYHDLIESEIPVDNNTLNPLVITDVYQGFGRKKIVGFHQDGSPIYQIYKGGRIPKTAKRNLGVVDLLRAIEFSSNPYFALIAGDILKDPENLAKAARFFSYGEKTGLDLPAEIKGGIPSDLSQNKTGLYAFSIGQHTFVATPIQSATMLSAIANGGKVLKPNIIHMLAGKQPRSWVDEITYQKGFSFEESLKRIGLDFPLFTEPLGKGQKNLVNQVQTEVVRELEMPKIVRQLLLEGMHRVIERTKSTGLWGLSQLYRQHPEMVRALTDLKGEFIGKSSTSESVENVNLDAKLGCNKYNHIWFGGISFSKGVEGDGSYIFRDQFGEPELVVVVYLRFGEWGKDSTPVAAEMVKKWREIRGKMGY